MNPPDAMELLVSRLQKTQTNAEFLMSMKEFPPSQSPGSFNLSKIEEQLREMRTAERALRQLEHKREQL